MRLLTTKRGRASLKSRISDAVSRLTGRFFSGGVSGAKTGRRSKGRRFGYDKSKTLIYLTYAATFALFGLLFALFSAIILFAAYSRYLPNPNQLLERSTELSTKILDRNGEIINEVYGEKNRSLIMLDQVSPYLVHATLATEDSNFYQHRGFDLKGMVRAVLNTVTGEGLQGGSTITQQVVKNALLTQDRTVSRKIKEFILSLQLENKYAKDQILQMYLNETPYGGQNYGALTASKAYFGKEPGELTLAESAFLAGLPQRPSYYSPYSTDPSIGLERKDYVLYLMLERGWIDSEGKRHFISQDEYDQAKEEELHFQPADVPFNAPHFVFYVKQLLADRYGEDVVEQGGLVVKTSLDLDVQNTAEKIVKEEVEKAAPLNVGNGGLVAIDPKTGQIIAMVGSKDYFAESEPEGCISGITGENSCTFEPNLNVVLAKRQPGSSIKPITYATMLSQGYTASFPFLDVPTVFEKADGGTKDYIPVNYDGQFRGPMSLRKALANSINIAAVKALKIVGIDDMIKTAQKLGITTFDKPERYGLSLTLGGGETKLLEMTGAFASFAAKGMHREPVAILEVTNVRGDEIYKWRDNGGERAVSEEVAFLISDILSDDGARSSVFGFGSLLHIPGHQVAVKTGTTDDKRDNYAIGFTPSIAVGVWVGNNNNDAMNPYLASGITGATPIWHRFTVEYLADKQTEDFETPAKVKKVTVDELTGMLPFEDRPSRPEWFINGTEPTSVSPWYTTLEICKPDGKLASDECRSAGKTEKKDFVKITAELPEWQDDVDSWVHEHYNESKYFPPTTESKLEFEGDGDVKEDVDPKVSITDLDDGDHVPSHFRLKVEVSSPNDIDNVRIFMDGNQVTTDKSVPYGYNFEIDPGNYGLHEFKVVAVDEDGRDGDKNIKLYVGN